MNVEVHNMFNWIFKSIPSCSEWFLNGEFCCSIRSAIDKLVSLITLFLVALVFVVYLKS